MERMLKIYLPSAALTFTGVMLCTSVMNLLAGYEALSNRWILQVLGYIVSVEVLDCLLGRVAFKRYAVYFAVEAVAAYLLMLACAYAGKWFSFDIGEVIRVSILFFAIMGGIHAYFYRMAKSRANEINRMLREKS